MDIKKSAFEYQCPVCNFVTESDKAFKRHIENTHGRFRDFKEQYGSCEYPVRINGGGDSFQCFICAVTMIHRASVVEW